MDSNRRSFIQGASAAGLSLAIPQFAMAQSKEPIQLGLLTVKTGPLASGGIDMERGIQMYLAERNYTLAGRKINLIVAD